MSTVVIQRNLEDDNYVWDTNTMMWVKMQQPILNAGSVTISGSVDQGTGGVSPWLVTGPLTDTQLRASSVPVVVSGVLTTSGSISTINTDVTLTLTGNESVCTINIDTGSGSPVGGTIVFEGRATGGSTFFSLAGVQSTATQAEVSTAAAGTGLYFLPCAGLDRVRARASVGYSGGTKAVSITASQATIQKRAGNVTISSITTPVSTKTDLSPAPPTFASVGSSSAQIVNANAARKGLVLTNTSTNRISIAFGTTAVLDSGITLLPSGGTFVMDEYMFDTGAVNAISPSSGNNIAVQDFS